MRILTVFGTRPEAIKMAPVIQAAKREGLEIFVCLTAQHRDMLDQVLDVFKIKPDFDLNLMQENQSPLSLSARIFEHLPSVLNSNRPDWLLVQGDTTTAFAAAFVAYQSRTRVGHIEAGLRTPDKWQPFPEEMNRRLVSRLADIHFAATQSAADALRAEGVPPDRIFLTGNTVVDSLSVFLKQPVRFTDTRLNALADPFVLVTAHRRENFGLPLEQICLAVLELLSKFPNLQVVFPVHPNPNVIGTVQQLLGADQRILLTNPLAYPEFVQLMARAALILSDSGGIQEEAPSVGTRVLVLRTLTERPEAIESGWAELVGTSRAEILQRASPLLEDARQRPKVPGINPFGDGKAAERIVQLLVEFSKK
jgi:UDP-N-acetylglucosamine 2-epimerase (non-hydrolysing)